MIDTTPNTSKPSRALRWLRLTAFMFAVVAACAWWKVRQVSADFTERSATLGRELGKLKEVSDGTSTLKLNGQRLTLTSVVSDASVDTVLDRFAATCAKSSGGIVEELRDAEANGVKLPAYIQTESLGVLRLQKDENEGSAACFAREGSGGFRDLVRRLEQFADTGDAAALGQLRWVFVRHRSESNVTHVLAATTLGRIPLGEMFPADGDAPGGDVLDDVRPASSRRLISAQLEGTKHTTALYEAASSPEMALRSYDAPMRARGFAPGDLSAADGMNPVPTRVYFKADDVVLVLAVQQEQNSLVSAFRLMNGGFVSMRQ